MDCHNIALVEGFRAIGTFPHTVGDTIVNTVVAESVTTCLDCCVFEVLSTDSA